MIPPSYSLFLSSGGGGTVAPSPTNAPYLSNTVVTLTATPNAGWAFLQWLGDASGANATTNVAMTRNKSAQAIFGTTLSATAAGGGSVLFNPLATFYPYGTPVQLSAIPVAGNYFGVWGNAASGNVNPLTFVVTNANQTVSSLFAAVGGGQAALTVVPVGLGTVSVSPRANVYSIGSGVTITAIPSAGQSFTGWSGDASGTQNPLPLTLNANKLIYANFTKRPALALRAGFDGWKDNGFQFSLTGDFGYPYQIEGSTNLADWAAVGFVTNLYGTAEFLDSTTTNSPLLRFYRVRLLP